MPTHKQNNNGPQDKTIHGKFPGNVQVESPHSKLMSLAQQVVARFKALDKEQGSKTPRGKSLEKALALLQNTETKETQDKLSYFLAAVIFLDKAGFYTSRDYLVFHATEILSHDTWKVFQLHECVSDIPCDAACQLFLEKYVPLMNKTIYWRPLIDKLCEYDDVSITAELMFGDDFENYVQQWDKSVVMAEEAIYKFGFTQLPSLLTGRAMPTIIDSEQGFATTSTGVIFIPPFENSYDDKEQNLTSYNVSFTHEVGHHMWKSFQINLSPEIFDYESFGMRYIRHFEKDGKVTVVIEKQGEQKDITCFEDLTHLVKYPMLLLFLHNVLDDSRVDANNVLYFKGLAPDYRKDIEYLFGKRPQLQNPDLTTLLEAILQYAITGKLRNEIPSALKGTFEKAKKIMNSVEYGPETDGTSAMNAAIKLYRMLEQDLENMVIQLSEQDLPNSMHRSKTKIGGKDQQPKVTVQKPQRGRRGKAGINPLQLINNGEGEGTEGKTGNQSNSSGKDKKQGGKQGNDNENKDGTEHGTGNKEEGKTKDKKDSQYFYDGWDGEKYIAGEHVVVETRADGQVVSPPPAEVERLKSIFRRYAPKQGVLVRGLEEGEIDPELLQDYTNELRCGRLPERKFYSEVVYEERDVATGVLIDLSGSTMHVREEILRAAGTLGVASDTLGDPLIVGGFTMDEKDAEEFIVMKDAFDKEILYSNRGGATPIGGPMRHMHHKMDAPGIRYKGFKQLFVITDGEANVGKNPIEDAAKAVDEAWKKHRIKTFALGIIQDEKERANMESYLDKIFGIGNYLILTTAEVEKGMLAVFFEKYYRKTVNKLR